MEVNEQQINIGDLIQNELPKVDFETDAHTFLHNIQMQIDPMKFVPCDPSGKFNDDCEVMFDEKTN